MLVVAESLVIVPDAVRFVKPLILLLFIATSAPNAIPVLLKLMIGVLDMFSSLIEVDFNVSCVALYKFPFTVSSVETVRDGVVIELEAVRFVKPLILLLFIATLAPNVIPVLLKLMIGVFDMFSRFIEGDFNVSDKALYKFPFTVRSFETVRDAAVIVPDVVNVLVVSVLVVSVLVVRLLLEIVPVAVILTTLIMLFERQLEILTYTYILWYYL